MIARWGIRLVLFAAVLAAVGAIVWPTIAVIADCLAARETANSAAVFTGRQGILLLKSIGLSAGATALSLLLAIVPAWGLAQRRGTTHFLFLFCLSGVVLCPPMVYVFGWQRLLPASTNPWAMCLFVWAAWAWPIASLILASGWQACQGPYEAALLEAGRARAIIHVLVPNLRPYAGVSALVLFVMFFGDYGVPHACGLIVYATEILGWAANTSGAMETVLPSIPATITILMGLAAIAWFMLAHQPNAAGHNESREESFGPVIWVALALGLASWLVPITVLLWHAGAVSPFGEALRTYAFDLRWSFGTALAAGFLVAVFACSTVLMHRTRFLIVGWSVAFGALPAALVGKALVMGFNRPEMAAIYDHAAIVSLGYFSRFAWLGALAGLVMARDLRSESAAQAAIDGATPTDILRFLILPNHRRLLAALVFMVAALSLGEVPTTTLIRVPAFAPVSLTIIEKFHRFEDEMLIALSMILVAASLPAALTIARAWGGLRRQALR